MDWDQIFFFNFECVWARQRLLYCIEIKNEKILLLTSWCKSPAKLIDLCSKRHTCPHSFGIHPHKSQWYSHPTMTLCGHHCLEIRAWWNFCPKYDFETKFNMWLPIGGMEQSGTSMIEESSLIVNTSTLGTRPLIEPVIIKPEDFRTSLCLFFC